MGKKKDKNKIGLVVENKDTKEIINSAPDPDVKSETVIHSLSPTPLGICTLKFYPPPDGCEMCWKQRFAEYRRLIDQFGLTKDGELTIEIIGECTKQKLERFHNWLTNYLHTFYNDSIKLTYVDHNGAKIS